MRFRLCAQLSSLVLLGSCGDTPTPAAPETSDTAATEPDTADGQPDEGPGDVASPEDTTDVDEADDVAAVDLPDAAPPLPELGPTDALEWVDPLIGTGAEGFNYGATPPGAMLPFAMARLSPDTGDENGATFGVAHAGGYRYEDPYLLGFSHIHLVGTGIADYGNLLVMPVRGAPEASITWQKYRAPLDHAAETARAGYYRMQLGDRGVTAELTATLRTGVHRYTFEGAEPAHLVVDLGHTLGTGKVNFSDVTVVPETGEVSGWLWNEGEFSDRFGGFKLYFVGRTSRAPAAVGVFDANGFHAAGTHATEGRTGAVLTFDPAGGPVELQVGLSFVDLDGARKNLEAEAGTFDAVREAAEAEWRAKLAVVEVAGGTEKRLKILMTGLYHVALMPTLLMDVDGRYRGIDQEVHEADGFTYYSDLSLWDTYRTFHPLVALLWPADQQDFLASLAAMARDWGSLPKWPLAIGEGGSMIGSSADVVLGDAILAGFDVDLDTVWPIVGVTAFGPGPEGKGGRDGLTVLRYAELGYVPADEFGGSVSKTLEYAIEDACDAVIAEAAGAPDEAAVLAGRAASWKAHFDPSEALLAPKNADGSIPKYLPNDWSQHYTEGNAWQYTFMVPHDPWGLVQLLGDRFLERLTELLEGVRIDFQILVPTGYYWHGNEPGLLTTWLFPFAGRPDLTRWWVRWAADAHYDVTPGGLAGNDDGGSLSAWYVFAAAGFYPLSCRGEYVLSAPLFDRTVWHLPAGDLEIRLGEEGSAPTWNEQPIDRPVIDDAPLRGGGLLVLPRQPETKNPPK